MQKDIYIQTLKNEGFGLVEDVKVIHEGSIVTTIEVTKDIAMNLHHNREEQVSGATVYASLLPEEDLHYSDAIRVIDIATRLTTELSRSERNNIYKTMTNNEEPIQRFETYNEKIKTNLDEDNLMFVFDVQEIV